MRVTLNAWPDKTPDFVSHRVMNEYIIDTSRKSGVHGVTLFGAKVTNIEKVNELSKWQVSWTELREDDETGEVNEQEKNDVSHRLKYCIYSTADVQFSSLTQLWLHLDIIMRRGSRI